jgi:hypothetical protein
MSQLRVESFTVSLDGCGAGPNQRLERPLGQGGEALPGWLTATPLRRVRADASRARAAADARRHHLDDPPVPQRRVGRPPAPGAIAPVLPGSGEALLAGIDLPALGYRIVEHVPWAQRFPAPHGEGVDAEIEVRPLHGLEGP